MDVFFILFLSGNINNFLWWPSLCCSRERKGEMVRSSALPSGRHHFWPGNLAVLQKTGEGQQLLCDGSHRTATFAEL